jgi:DnaA family protein
MQDLATQLPLRLSPNEVYQLDNFHFCQSELEQVVTDFCQEKTIPYLYLWGEAASGKSHLLMAMTEYFQQQSQSAAYISLNQLMASTTPDVLESFEHIQVICLDELESIEMNQTWEEALFHFFNKLQANGSRLVIGSRHNPASSQIVLPDLRSRLATGLVYQMESLDDEAKLKALNIQAQARGLELSVEVASYLLRHYSRDIRELINLLVILDKASMAAKRRLTIPFIRQALADG